MSFATNGRAIPPPRGEYSLCAAGDSHRRFAALLGPADLLPRDRTQEPSAARLPETWSYEQASLLIVDGLGFSRLLKMEAELPVDLIRARALVAVTVFTTAEPVETWPEILTGDAALVLVLKHHSHVIELPTQPAVWWRHA